MERRLNMKRRLNGLICSFAVLLLSLPALQGANASEGKTADRAHAPASQVVTGVLNQMNHGMIFIEIEPGNVRNFTIKPGEEDLKGEGLNPGDRVVLELDADNQVVDIHKILRPESGETPGGY